MARVKAEDFNYKKYFRDNLFMMVFLFSALVTLVVSAMTIINMNNTVVSLNSAKENMDTTKSFLESNYEYRLHATAAAAQHLLTGDDLDKLRITPTSPSDNDSWFRDENFLSIRERLIKFGNENGLEFIYYYFRIDNYIQPLIDNDPDIVNAYTPSSELFAMDANARAAWNNKEISVATGEFLIDNDGLMTAYAPIFGRDGEVAALVGVDIRDTQIGILSEQIGVLSEQIGSLSRRIAILIAGMVAALTLLLVGGTLTFLAIRKRARALSEALNQANQASRAKSEFLANMSHEMRTPLNAVIGMTAIALKAADQERKEYCLEKIEEASTHLLGVINDVLDYSKIEADKFELAESEFDFEKMLQKACNVVAFKVAEKKQSFNVSIDMGIPRILMGDEQHAAQVVANFLANAVKFTPEDGKISLVARLAGEEEGRVLVRVEVSDSGIGISEEQQGRLFRSFEQADNTITKRFGGTGLGLAISKRIVGMMGGAVTLESELGKGSTFGFVAPFKRGLKQRDIPPGLQDLRVLVIDDDCASLEYLIDIMRYLGVVCDTVGENAKALGAALKNGAYDICFTAYGASGTGGAELTRGLKEKINGPVIIMAPSIVIASIENEAKSAGADKFITKPVFPYEVMDALSETMLPSADGHKEDAGGREQLSDFSGHCVLLVDDVAINREIVTALLEPTNITIDCAENGLAALKMFCENPGRYDVIFMDVQMPEMDGYQATRQIRALETPYAGTVPIIAMTANVFRDDIENALAAGMNAHIAKPVDFNEVLDKLKELI